MIHMGMLPILFLMALLLGGCPHQEPEIRTTVVEKAVPVPCKPAMPKRPALMTMEQVKVAVQGAATFDDSVKILSEQLLLYIGWVPIVEGALAGCATVHSN